MTVSAAKKYDFADLNVNARNIAEIGTEKTGAVLLNLLSEELAIDSWKNVGLLDIGCGVRFTQTLLNNDMEIGRYCGVDVKQDIVDALNAQVGNSNYDFHYWHVYNNLYNKAGEKFSTIQTLPTDVSDMKYACLISVFTHLNGPDSNDMLRILRASLPKGAKILFSIFIDNEIEADYIEVFPKNPSRTVKHRSEAFIKLLSDNNWGVLKFNKARPECYINDYFVCEAL